MENQNNTKSGGISFLGLLTIVFIVLKLCHVIDWSWFWVLAPLLIPTIIGVLFFIIIMIVACVTAILTPSKKRKKRLR